MMNPHAAPAFEPLRRVCRPILLGSPAVVPRGIGRCPAFESGRRGSNSQPSAWEADALPTELRPRDPHLSPGLLARPGLTKTPRRLEQMLGQDLDVREHGHEVRIAGPARDDVLVHMVGDTGAGDPAE